MGLGGLIAKIGHVEDAGAASGGEEDLLLVGGVSFDEEAVNEHEGFEGDGPVLGLVEAAGEGVDAGGDEGTGVAGQAQDLPHVPLLGGVFFVSGGFDDGHVQIGEGVAVPHFR